MASHFRTTHLSNTSTVPSVEESPKWSTESRSKNTCGTVERNSLQYTYNADDTLGMRFEYADGRMPVSVTEGGQRYFLAYDQIGSLRIVANASGTVIRRIEYDTFGNIVDDSDPFFDIPFGFAGGLHDRHTGLVRFGFRDYDPDTGRWTAKDPIGFAGGIRICSGIALMILSIGLTLMVWKFWIQVWQDLLQDIHW